MEFGKNEMARIVEYGEKNIDYYLLLIVDYQINCVTYCWQLKPT